MRLARRRRSGALLLLLCASCAGTARAPGSAARGESSPPTVRSEEEYAAARAEFDALPPLDPQRAPRRRALADYLLRECGVALDRAHPDDAEPPFKQALSLYSFAELRDAARPGARNTGEATGLLVTARRYEAAFRKRGAHEQVVMALGAQISVAPLGDPESAREARRRYDEVVAWLEGTPGARSDEDSREGAARLVEDLEATMRVLSSPFLVDELARRYRGPAPPAPRGGRASLRALREMIGEEPHGPRAYELARVFLRVGDPARARAGSPTRRKTRASSYARGPCGSSPIISRSARSEARPPRGAGGAGPRYRRASSSTRNGEDSTRMVASRSSTSRAAPSRLSSSERAPGVPSSQATTSS